MKFMFWKSEGQHLCSVLHLIRATLYNFIDFGDVNWVFQAHVVNISFKNAHFYSTLNVHYHILFVFVLLFVFPASAAPLAAATNNIQP